MNESAGDALTAFTTEELEELAIGLGEMTGLNDEEIDELLLQIPYGRGSLSVRDLCALGLERATVFSMYLEFSYADGQKFFITRKPGEEKCIVHLEDPVAGTGAEIDEIDNGWG